MSASTGGHTIRWVGAILLLGSFVALFVLLQVQARDDQRALNAAPACPDPASAECVRSKPAKEVSKEISYGDGAVAGYLGLKVTYTDGGTEELTLSEFGDSERLLRSLRHGDDVTVEQWRGMSVSVRANGITAFTAENPRNTIESGFVFRNVMIFLAFVVAGCIYLLWKSL